MNCTSDGADSNCPTGSSAASINAAYTCYRNYCKYEFLNRKLDVNKSYLLLGNSEIILIPEFPSK